MPRTLIVIPSYNERDNIVKLVDRILELHPENMDVLVVDDSSPDNTADVIREAMKKHGAKLELHVREGKGGRGSAVLHGFKYALEKGYDLVFEMDADFSHEPTEIQRFLNKIPNYDMVLGSRYLKESAIHNWGFKRTFFSRWANRYARCILRIPISDYTNGYRCYKRSAIEAIDFDSIDAKGYVVLSEVAYQFHRKNMKIGEVPTIFVNRCRGISNLSRHEIKEAFLSVLRIRFALVNKLFPVQ